MKQILQTHLGKALLCLLMVVLGGSNAWGETYKLEKVTSVVGGSLYVFEQSGHVMTNSISNKALQTTTTYKTTGLEGTENYVWLLESQNGGGFKMKNVSIDGANCYLTNSSSTTASWNSQGNASVWTFSFEDGIALIQNKSNSNRYLGFTNATSYAYKAYAISDMSYSHAITVYKLVEEGDPNVVATTTAIVSSGITNTDVYVSTEAGTLTATVKDESDNAVAGATVTWTSDNEGVATINATTGKVTLVAAGTVTFTASYAGVSGEYQASSDTYEMTVTSSAPYVQPTEIEITPNYTFWGKDAQFSGNDFSTLSGSQDNVTLNWTKGNGSTYANQNAMRFYKDNELTFTAPTGYEIKNIELEGSLQADMSFSPTGFNSETKKWTGASTTVTMSRPSDGSSYATINTFTITIGLPSSVPTPTFSVAEGTYFEAQNVKVSNYVGDYMYFYTTDGTAPACDSNLDPTGTSIEYDDATGIDITATTTLKMIAVDIDGNKSNVASATYTFPTVYTSIADFKAAETTGYLNLTGAQVVYIDGDKKNIYVRDASGAIDLFNNSGFSTTLQSGDLLSGIIKGTYTLYKQMPEITSIENISVLTVTGNETVVAKVIDGTTTAIEDNLCDLVKIENTEITGSDPYYVGDNSDIQLYDKWKVGYTVTTDKAVDVSGVAINFDGTYEIYPRFESDIVYLDNAVEVSISAYGYATFCSDKALDFTATDAIEVYYGTLAGDKLTFSRIYKVPANTGVLLRSALGGAVAATNVPVFDGVAADDVTDNCLTGVTETTTLNANDYILNVVNGGAGFYKAGEFTSLAANRAYIRAALVGGGIKSFGINLTTGIDLPATEKAEKVIFDLSGRRVEKPAKGLYIVNGKKVLF